MPLIQVIEEKGPISYDNEGDEDEEQVSDYDDDDMTYPGDPLHLSDYEGVYYLWLPVLYIYLLFPYKEILKMEMIIKQLKSSKIISFLFKQ